MGDSTSQRSAKLRWFQFRLGNLLHLTAVIALILGWLTDHIRQERLREYSETMLKAYHARYAEEREEELGSFRNMGIGRSASRVGYASPDELIADLISAPDWQAVDKVRRKAQASDIFPAATPQVLKLIESPSADLRERGIYMLGASRSDAEGTILAISNALTDPNAAVRVRAARSLGEYGPAAESAVDQLDAALDDSDPGVRAWAADALWRVSRAPQAVEAMIELIDGPASDARLTALDALRETDSMLAAPAIPQLVKLLDDADRLTREIAITALAKLAPRETAIKALSGACDRLQGHERQLAAAMLIELDTNETPLSK